jgi:carboxypeptidase Q
MPRPQFVELRRFSINSDGEMTLRRFFLAPFVLAWILTVSAQQTGDLQQTTSQLTASIYTGPSMKTLRDLTDGIGGRLTGSPAHNRAAEWAHAEFRSAGIQNVRLESFTIPNGWQRGTARGEMLAPFTRTLHIESLGWAPSTPAGGVKGEVVVIDDLAMDALKAKADQIRDKIVMLDSAKIFADGFFKVFPLLGPSYKFFHDKGVQAVIFPDHELSDVLNAHDADWGARIGLLPAGQLGMEDTRMVRRLLDQGPVTIQYEAENKVSGPTPVNNVVAEIRGSERPDEWILIGAHLDSWDFATGAQDNGTGAVSVIEVARAIAALGKPLRRSVRFALWGGEEQGILGSYAYTQAHLKEMDKCVAVLNTDNGAGHPKGWKVEGRKDLQEAMQPLSDTLLKDIGGGALSMETTYDTDHGPFMLMGIPALDLWVDMSHYGEIHHKSSDTFDKVDPVDFKAGEAIVAVTAYTIAQQEKPIASHISHTEVADIIRKADLTEMLTIVGQWKP